MVPNMQVPIFRKKFNLNRKNILNFAIPKPPRLIYGGSQTRTQMTEAEKERWQIIGVIASAIGTAIVGYFAGKK